ncbi:MAG: beta strand repeat-containing protein [Roseiarcus sp.]
MTRITATWKNDASGAFGVASNWSTGAVPGANTIAELTATGAAYTVTSGAVNTVYQLWAAANATLAVTADTFSVTNFLDSEGAIDVSAGAALALGVVGSGGGFVNGGSIKLSGGTSPATEAKLEIEGSIDDLIGSGTLTLSNSAYNEIIGGTSSAMAALENDANTISGAGTIGDKYLTFDNSESGTVDATDSTKLLINGAIGSIAASTATDENDGLIETTGTGGLRIDADMYNNGQLLADGSGALTLGAGVLAASPTIEGGGEIAAVVSGAKIYLDDVTVQIAFVSTVAGSSITSLAGTTNSISSGEFTNDGSLVVAAGSTLNLSASVQNAGTISLAGSASAEAKLLISGDGAQLIGAGHLILSNSTNNLIGAAASDATSGAQFKNNQGGLIEGAGTIGDANLRFLNFGTVDADDSAGLTLVGDTNSNLSSDYNTGLIEDTGSGTLTIENTWTNAGAIEQESASGALDLLNFVNPNGGGHVDDNVSGGVINLTNANISGSYLQTVAGSVVNVTASSTSTIDDQVFNHGSIYVDSATLIGNGDYYNYGTLELDGSGAASTLELNGGFELRGDGDLILGNSTGNSIVSNGSPQSFANFGNTISGSGTIGDAHMSFSNYLDGTVDANGATALTLAADAGEMLNAGLMESTGAGGLTISGNLINSGVLKSTAGLLDVTGNLGAFGQAEIGGTGSIEFGGSLGQDVTFLSGASGSLILDHSSVAGDTPSVIKGFAAGDTIDLRDIQDIVGTTKSFAAVLGGGTLTVSDGTHTTNLILAGSYTTGSFSLSSDGHSGTLVSFA